MDAVNAVAFPATGNGSAACLRSSRRSLDCAVHATQVVAILHVCKQNVKARPGIRLAPKQSEQLNLASSSVMHTRRG